MYKFGERMRAFLLDPLGEGLLVILLMIVVTLASLL